MQQGSRQYSNNLGGLTKHKGRLCQTSKPNGAMLAAFSVSSAFEIWRYTHIKFIVLKIVLLLVWKCIYKASRYRLASLEPYESCSKGYFTVHMYFAPSCTWEFCFAIFNCSSDNRRTFSLAKEPFGTRWWAKTWLFLFLSMIQICRSAIVEGLVALVPINVSHYLDKTLISKIHK